MNSTESSKKTIKDSLLWTAVAVVTICAFWLTYSFDFSGPIRALIWVCWLVLVFLLGFFTTTGAFIFDFTKEAKIELQKVVWPSRKETIQTTSIVMLMVAITGFVLWGVDSGMMWAIGKITHLG